FFSSRRRHTRFSRDWSSDVCSSDLKETLVVAGQLINELVAKKGVKLLPVDSEHSAIFQCLTGEESNPIEKIILTASGGPFRGKRSEERRVGKDCHTRMSKKGESKKR